MSHKPINPGPITVDLQGLREALDHLQNGGVQFVKLRSFPNVLILKSGDSEETQIEIALEAEPPPLDGKE